MKKAKKVLALILALAMCMTLVSSLAFAEDGSTTSGSVSFVTPGEFIPEGVDVTIPWYDIVILGDEYVNGYGLPGYGKSTDVTNVVTVNGETFDVGALDKCATASYARTLGNSIQKALGGSFQVKTTSLCFNGMRAGDLQYILEGGGDKESDAYADKLLPYYEQWFTDNATTLNENRMSKTDYEKLNDLQKLVCTTAPYYDLQDYMISKLKDTNGSLIVLDLGNNNFGTYLLNRIVAAVAWIQAGNKDFDDASYPYYGDDPEGIHGDLVLGSEDMLRLLVENFVEEFFAGFTQPLIDEVSDAFMYAFFDYCISISKDIAYLKYLAPLSQVIVVSPYNIVDDLAASLPYPDSPEGKDTGRTMEIPVDSFWATYIGIANTYLTNSEVGSQCKLANLNDVDVETLYDDLVNTNKLSDFYKEKIGEEMLAMVAAMKPELGEAAKTVVKMTQDQVTKAYDEAIATNNTTNLGYVKGAVADAEAKAVAKFGRALTDVEKIGVVYGVASALANPTEGDESTKNAMKAAAPTAYALANYQLYNFLVVNFPMYKNIENASKTQLDKTAKKTVYNPYTYSTSSLSDIKSIQTAALVEIDYKNSDNYGILDNLNLYARLLAGTGIATDFIVTKNIKADEIVSPPIGTLPSANGHTAKLQAVLKAWVIPGNSTYQGEDAAGNLVSNFFSSMLGSFKIPVLDTINVAFRNFMVNSSNFFNNLFAGIKDIFVRG